MEPILLESEPAAGVVRLSLNRPAQRNALDGTLIGALQAAVASHATRPATRVLLIAAEGTAFCAGADLHAMLALGRGDRAASVQDASQLAALLLALRDCPKPSIALVQGPAFGGGMGLAAACDVAIGSTAARFRLPEVQLGLVPAVISPYVIEALGHRQARRYFLSGEQIDAARAVELGLLHLAVAPEALAAEGLRLAAEIAQGGPHALAEAKRLIAAVGHQTPGAATAASTAAWLATLRAGAEAQEGIDAALARRTPGWRS
ncbi:MAG: enoyl-CoA hydratase/isomerase family protein [Proteobacteria bacterium]|nr:enoyl-CoA hydratase/isomerase family protein [Pseudomonadota bacterium]